MSKKNKNLYVLVFCGGIVSEKKVALGNFLETARKGLEEAIRLLKEEYYSFFVNFDRLPALVVVRDKRKLRFFYRNEKGIIREIKRLKQISRCVENFSHFKGYKNNLRWLNRKVGIEIR